jgi:hypothetical protein
MWLGLCVSCVSPHIFTPVQIVICFVSLSGCDSFVTNRSSLRTYRVESPDELFADICAQQDKSQPGGAGIENCLKRIKDSQNRVQLVSTERTQNSFLSWNIFHSAQPKLFHSSRAHKRHGAYTLSDVCALDSNLCELIVKDAEGCGYKREEL